MPIYTIMVGDSLATIAAKYGLTWMDLYNRAENEEFRGTHPDPTVLRPGQSIWVPALPKFEGDAFSCGFAYVTRCTETEPHHNAICSSYSLYLRIFNPLLVCMQSNFSFILSSDDGTYRKTQSLNNGTETDGDTYLIFDAIKPQRNYTLSVERPDSKPQVLIDAVAYLQLPLFRGRAAYKDVDFIPSSPGPLRYSDYSFEPLFTPQEIDVLGEGQYHVNRFRIYFRADRWVVLSGAAPMENFPRRVTLTVAFLTNPALVAEFIRDFPLFFNGGVEGNLSGGIKSISWTELQGQKIWKRNMALVVRHNLRGPNGVEIATLGFELDIQPLRVVMQKVFRGIVKSEIERELSTIGLSALTPVIENELDRLLPIEMPEHPSTDIDGSLGGLRQEFTNFHADWVGIVLVDGNRGFAVQTLWRHRRDWASQRLVDIIDNAALPMKVKLFAHRQEEELFELFNQFHFLAGRRSWVIGSAEDPLAGDYVTVPKNGIFFLETAAIERYSQAIHDEITSHDPGVVVAVREAVKTIWIRCLMNYARMRGFEVVAIDKFEERWEKEAEVNYRELAFDRESDLKANAIVQEIVKLHPILEEQLRA